MTTLRFPLLALASLTLAPASYAGTPAQFTLLEQNGHLACDNTGTCRMVAFGAPAAFRSGVLAATFVGRHCLGDGQRHWQLPTCVTELR